MDHLLNNDLNDTLSSIGSIVNTIENEADDKGRISIHWLNDDCLRIIFSFISRKTLQSINVQLVCKRWFTLINSMIFCRAKLNLFIEKDGDNKDNDVVHIGGSLFNIVQALYFSGGKVYELILSSTFEYRLANFESRFIAVKELCPNLVNLTMSRYVEFLKIKPEDVPFSFPSNLCELSLTHIWMKEHTLSHILKLSSKTLQKLKLSRSAYRLSGLSIMEHLQECKMKVLDFSGCYRLSPTVLPFIFKTYHETLEELHFSSSLMTLPVPDGLVMKKLKSVTLYEVYREGGIKNHDEDVVLRLFKSMANIEDLTILTDGSPLYPRFESCQFFDYLSKIMMLKNLKNLTLPLEPMKHQMFGQNSFFRELCSLSSVKIRIDSEY